MLFHLIKKDFLIVRKNAVFVFGVCILLPPFMLWRIPDFAGPMSFCLSAIISVFLLLQDVSQKENQYPKVNMLLCASPYPRKLLVLSRYVFCLIIYAACCVIFLIETLIFHKLGTLQLEMPILMFFVISMLIGLYLPAQYKLGYEKTKVAFMIISMAPPFILPQLLKMNSGINFPFLNTISMIVLYGGISMVSLLILAVSVKVSAAFFDRIDLV